MTVEQPFSSSLPLSWYAKLTRSACQIETFIGAFFQAPLSAARGLHLHARKQATTPWAKKDVVSTCTGKNEVAQQ